MLIDLKNSLVCFSIFNCSGISFSFSILRALLEGFKVRGSPYRSMHLIALIFDVKVIDLFSVIQLSLWSPRAVFSLYYGIFPYELDLTC